MRFAVTACLEICSLLGYKHVAFFSGLQSTVATLAQCLKKLFGAIVLTLFSLTVFSLLGMGLFMGNLKHKCLRWPQENENETLYNRTGSQYYIPGESGSIE